MPSNRKILHIDMDAFFAAVEQRDNPDLRGKPLVVGGSPEGRGVVAAASYEARRFGIRSAMPASHALRLCPSLHFVSPRLSRYREESKRIMEIFREYSDCIEPLSLDEAFLDVSENKQGLASATETAARIKANIWQHCSLTASAGVAPNKFLAKIASAMNKPDGLTVIKPQRVAEVLRDLPVRKVPGIGRVTEEKMAALGIWTTGDLQRYPEQGLTQLFGKLGRWYYQLSHGIDDRPVNPERIRKSVSVEDTFTEDSFDVQWMSEQLTILSESLARRLHTLGIKGRTVTLKVTYADFSKCSRSKTLLQAVQDPNTLQETAIALLTSTEAGSKAVRLLGIGVSSLESEATKSGLESSMPAWQQLSLPFSHSTLASTPESEEY